MEEIIKKIIDQFDNRLSVWVPGFSYRPVKVINELVSTILEERKLDIYVDRVRTLEQSTDFLTECFENEYKNRIFNEFENYEFEKDSKQVNIIEYAKEGLNYLGQSEKQVGKALNNNMLDLAVVCFIRVGVDRCVILSDYQLIKELKNTQIIGVEINSSSFDEGAFHSYSVEDSFFCEIIKEGGANNCSWPKYKEKTSLAEWCIGENINQLVPAKSALFIGDNKVFDSITYFIEKEKKELSIISDGFNLNVKFLLEKKYKFYNKFLNEQLHKLYSENLIEENVTPLTLDVLLRKKIISNSISKSEFLFLQDVGIFLKDLIYRDGSIFFQDGSSVRAILNDDKNLVIINQRCLGIKLIGSVGLSFSNDIPLKLKDSKEISVMGFDEIVERESRLGALVIPIEVKSISLDCKVEEVRLNKLSSLNEHIDSRYSVIYLKSTFEKKAQVFSSIVFNDLKMFNSSNFEKIVITEYGVVNLVSLSSQNKAIELLKISDSRFQDELLSRAKRSGLIHSNYKLDKRYRHNYPEVLLHKYKDREHVEYPLGHSYKPEELEILCLLDKLNWNQSSSLSKFFKLVKAKIFPEEAINKKEAEFLLNRLSLVGAEKLKTEVYSNLIIKELNKKELLG